MQVLSFPIKQNYRQLFFVGIFEDEEMHEQEFILVVCDGFLRTGGLHFS